MTLAEVKTRLHDMGYEYDAKWLERFRQRLNPIPWGGAFGFDVYVEHVSAGSAHTQVELSVVRFPSGRRRVLSVTATMKPKPGDLVSLSQAITGLEQKFGPAERIMWNEAYPRQDNVTWNGAWQVHGKGIGNWLTIDLVTDIPKGPGDVSPDAEVLAAKVVVVRHSFSSMLVGRHAETAWSGEHAGWIADASNGCRVWNNFPRDGDRITWNGPCEGKKAEGVGTLKWYSNGHSYETVDGTFRDGRISGFATVTLRDGRHFKGEFRDNRPNGPGTLSDNGMTFQGDWSDGCLRQNGHSVAFYTHRDLCQPF